LKREHVVAIGLLLLVVAGVAVFQFDVKPQSTYKVYNEYGEGATLSVRGGARTPGLIFDWEHAGSTVSSVSWTYSVSVSNLQGVAHWNLTMYFGYKVGSGSIVQIDSKTVTFQTAAATISDSGSESLDTHMGRFVSNPADGQSYSLYYYVRWVFSYLGAKSGNIYTVTNDGDDILEATDWTQVDSDSVTYVNPTPAEGIHAIYWSVDDQNYIDELTDDSDSTHVHNTQSYTLRVFFYASSLELSVSIRAKYDKEGWFPSAKTWLRNPSTGDTLGSGNLPQTDFGDISIYDGDISSVVETTSDGLYAFDIVISLSHADGYVSEVKISYSSSSGNGGTGGGDLEPPPSDLRDDPGTGSGDWDYPEYSWADWSWDGSSFVLLALLIVAVPILAIWRRRK